MLKPIMVLLWTILLVALLFVEAQNVMEVKGELGRNIALSCSNYPTIHWYMESYSQFKVYIGYSPSSGSPYYFSNFETKFTILGKTLVIKNVTAEDSRLYFCGRMIKNKPQLVAAFHLVLNISPSTEPARQQQNISTAEHQLLIIYRSAFLITDLILLILVVGFTSLWLKMKNHRNQVDEPHAVTSENAETLQVTQD